MLVRCCGKRSYSRYNVLGESIESSISSNVGVVVIEVIGFEEVVFVVIMENIGD